MDSSARQGNGDGQLNDSWVELNFQQQQRSGVATPEAALHRQVPLPGLSHNQMEKLLLEAANESRGSSRGSSRISSQASSRGSPKSPHSPNNELAPGLMGADIQTIQRSSIAEATYRVREGEVLQAVQRADIPTDWIWDWSSRPEVMPPSDYGKQFKHPGNHGSKLSVRNSKVLRSVGVFTLDNLPTLLVTHACTFFLGAAAMFIYLKKYCNWTAVAASPMD